MYMASLPIGRPAVEVAPTAAKQRGVRAGKIIYERFR
jgi:hypothetical protein